MSDNRPNWDSTYMEMCKILAKRSTCLRIQTASIIVKNNVIVSIGYNGVASGQQHCCDFWKQVYDISNSAILYAPYLTVKDKLCIEIVKNNILRPLKRYDDTKIGYLNGLQQIQNEQNISFDEFLMTDFFYQKHHEWSNDNELHGEMNAILFAGKNGIPLNNATIYTIYSPCINCAKAILTSGIKCIIYQKTYKRSTSGIEFLQNCGINITKLD